MRLIEFIFTCIVILNIVFPKKKLAIIYCVFFVLHFFIDGVRWQLTFVYFIGLLYTILVFSAFNLKRKRIIIPFLIFGIFSVFLAFLIPVFHLPKPTGDYSVGTKMIYLTDESRDEIFTEEKGDKRDISVKVWYPCDNVVGIPEDYWEDKRIGRGINSSMGLPGFILDHLSLVKSHSYRGMAISENKDKFPVVIYSHGLQSYLVQNRILMEELASQGYIVFSIGHNYDAAAIIDKSGDAVYFSKTLLNEMIDEWTQNKELYNKEHTGENVREIIKASTIDNRNMTIRAGDILYFLDYLPGYNKAFLNNKVDFKNIGIVGHSYGGGTAVEVLINDERVKAGISMDGYPYGSLAFGGEVEQPFMFLSRERVNDWTSVFKGSFNGDLYALVIRDTEHMDFTDTPIYSPIMSLIGFNGKHNGHRIIKIVNSHVIDFFDFYLKDDIEKLFIGSNSEFPEVKYN